MKALKNALWSASSASSRFLVMRCTFWISFRARGWHSAPKASACPCFAAATKAFSHIVVASQVLHRDDEIHLFCEQTSMGSFFCYLMAGGRATTLEGYGNNSSGGDLCHWEMENQSTLRY